MAALRGHTSSLRGFLLTLAVHVGLTCACVHEVLVTLVNQMEDDVCMARTLPNNRL